MRLQLNLTLRYVRPTISVANWLSKSTVPLFDSTFRTFTSINSRNSHEPQYFPTMEGKRFEKLWLKLFRNFFPFSLRWWHKDSILLSFRDLKSLNLHQQADSHRFTLPIQTNDSSWRRVEEARRKLDGNLWHSQIQHSNCYQHERFLSSSCRNNSLDS